MTTTLSRLSGFGASQLPMIVSDSPPVLPGTQRRIGVGGVDGVEPGVDEGVEQPEGWSASSAVQPKTLPPSTSGAISNPVSPRGRICIVSPYGCRRRRAKLVPRRSKARPHQPCGVITLRALARRIPSLRSRQMMKSPAATISAAPISIGRVGISAKIQ